METKKSIPPQAGSVTAYRTACGAVIDLANLMVLKREALILGIMASLVLAAYSFFPWATMRFDNPRFNSPDEAANYFFSARLASGLSMAASDSFGGNGNDLIHPRSARVVNGAVVPASFFGLPALYGALGWVLGPHIFPYLTPFITVLAVLTLYACWRRLFGRLLAALSVVLAAVHPAVWYYASRGFYHNLLFFDLAVFSVWGYLRLKESNWAPGWLFFSLLALILSFFVRASEIFWLAPLAMFAVYQERRQLRLVHTVIVILTIGAAAIVWILVSYKVYGQILPPGYTGSSAVGVGSHFLANLVSRLIWFIAPFGFSIPLALKNFFFYGLILFLPFSLSALIGLMYDRGKQIPRSYSVIAAWITVWLLIYYGSWEVADSVGYSSITVGSSYVRYWLPVYVIWLPYAALLILALARYLSGAMRRLWLAFMVLLFAALGFGQTYFDYPEGLWFTAERLSQYRLTFAAAETITPKEAIIIGDRADKVFFPERRVIVSDGRSVLSIPEVQESLPRLADAVPLFFHAVEPINIDQRSFLKSRRFIIADSVNLPDGSWLYSLIHL